MFIFSSDKFVGLFFFPKFDKMSANFDPILDKSDLESDKFAIGEIQNEEAFRLYKKALACFWVAEVIDIDEDVNHFENLSNAEKDFILLVLAFFAGADGIVLENVVTRFYEEVQQPEIRLFYGLQIAIENIHSEVYSDLIKAYIKDRDHRVRLFKSIDENPSVKVKAEWAQKWMDPARSFAERLVGFAAVEGIFFSSSFCAIFYFHSKGKKLPGLFQSNEYIARDEALHCEFACLLYNQLQPQNKATAEVIAAIIKDAVEVESVFVEEALRKPILGMNAPLMKQYVRYVADVLLVMLGQEKIYNEKNPFEFMNTISMDNKNNFFERRVTAYALADVQIDKQASMSKKLEFDAEF